MFFENGNLGQCKSILEEINKHKEPYYLKILRESKKLYENIESINKQGNDIRQFLSDLEKFIKVLPSNGEFERAKSEIQVLYFAY